MSKKADISELVSALQRTALFSSVAEASVQSLLARCQRVEVPAGAHVFRPTHTADRFYLVLSGRVRIFKVSPKGDEQTLHLCGPGDTFGEAALLAGASYPAFAEALSDAQLLCIGRRALMETIRREPELAMGMMAGLSAKLREFASLIEQISLKSVPARLANVLLEQARKADSNHFRLEGAKRQIALKIGTVPETLSRALAKLKSAGLVKVRGTEFTILDFEGLEQLAEEG